MNYTHCMVFSIQKHILAIEASMVNEVLVLPELKPCPEHNGRIAGLFNYRGRITPVACVANELGYDSMTYSLSSILVILKHASSYLGIIVDEVHEIQTVSMEEQEEFDENVPLPSWASGMAQLEEGICMIVDHFRLVEHCLEKSHTEHDAVDFVAFFDRLDESLKASFRKRAKDLKTRKFDFGREEEGSVGYAIVLLTDEYFAVDLRQVIEFTQVSKIATVPTAPPHIAGCMNYRGDVLTLLDATSVLEIRSDDDKKFGMVMVVRHGEQYVGILVEDVVDIDYIRPNEIETPEALFGLGNGVVTGSIRDGEHLIHVLDLHAIMKLEKLTENNHGASYVE